MLEATIMLGLPLLLAGGLWGLIYRERRRAADDRRSSTAGIALDLARIYHPSIEHVIKAEETQVKRSEDGAI